MGVALLAAVVITSTHAGGSTSVATCPGSHVYLGNYPKERSTGWSNETQGLAHDATHWYITQRDALWQFPVGFDLNSPIGGTNPASGVFRVPTPNISVAVRTSIGTISVAYNHLGDLEYYRGYLFVPMEGSRSVPTGVPPTSFRTLRLTPAVAVFRAPGLAFVGWTQIPQQSAGWIAIGPEPLLYSSNSWISPPGRSNGGPIFRYRIDFDALDHGQVRLTLLDRFPLRDEHGAPVVLETMQGGVFSETGCLYLVNGYDQDFDEDDGGISVFDGRTGKRVARSRSGAGPFNYEFHPGFSTYEEPEGITLWDLDDRRAPGVSGQLHVLMLDNDSGGDQIYIKHYEVR
jgi:hypothetical protein